MRKLKLFLMACTLMGAGTSWAQTDVTDTYITNAGFESDDAASNLTGSQTAPSGWNLTSSSGTSNTQWGTANASTTIQGYATSFSPSEGSNYFYLRCNWQSGTTLSLAQTTTSELSAGVYIISFDAVTYSSNGTQPTYTFKVNDGTNDVVAGTMKSNKTSWTNYKFIFNLTSASTVTITAAMKPGAAAGSKHDWMLLDNMRLLCFPSEEARNDYLIQQYNLTEANYANPILTSFVVNGTFDNGISPWQRTGGFQNNQTASNQQGAFTGNFYENWNGSAKVNKMYQTINNIPNGTYRLDICAFVNNLATPAEGQSSQTSQYVFANNDKTYLTTGDPTAYEVYTVVTNNQIEIGLEQTTATANWMGIDNVSLRYYGAGDVINAAQNASHKLAWEEAKTAAEAAIVNTDYANVTGKEKSDLQTEIGMAEPTTAQGYDDAAAALTTATQAFIAAAPAYNAHVAEIAYANAINVSTTAASAALNAEATAATVVLATQDLKVLEYTTIKAAYANDVTDMLGTWEAGNYGTTSGQGYIGGETYFDKWSGGAMDLSSSKTVTLPAGVYTVMVAGRGVSTTTMNLSVKVGEADAVSVPFLMIGDTGKGIDVNGATNFSEEGTYSNNNIGRGWQYRYLPFVLTAASEVTIAINGHLNGGSWQSFYAPVLLADNNTVLGISLAELAAAVTAAQDAKNEVSTLLTTAAQAADPSAEAVTYQYVVGGSEAAGLVAALSAAGTVNNTDMAAVQAATTALTEATEAYNAAKPAYERALMVIGMAKVSETIVGTIIYNYTVKPKVDVLEDMVANSETTAETIESEANNLMKSLMNYALLYKSKVMGFGVGEYAPYNNVDGLLLTEEAKQIGVAPENFTNQQIFDTFLALKDFDSWVVNTEDVDAIYNGMFATVAEGQNYPDGWTRTNGWGQMRSGISGDFATAYYNQPGSLQYGNQGVYTMPLKANQAYKLTFSYRSHENNSNKGVTVSVLNGEDGMPATTFSGNGSTSTWKTVEALFTTGAAGNYLLTLANSGNTWMTNVSLVKVESAAIAISENADYTPVETYANVELTRTIKGDGTWNTFVVPFDLSNEELKAAFGEDVAVAEYSETADGDNSTVNFITMYTPAITANTPVLLKGNAETSYTFSGKLLKTSEAKVEGTNFDFVGTYEATTTIAVGDYFIGGNKLWKSEGNTTIAGTRAYIKAKTTKAKVACFALDGGETTAINTVNGEGTQVNGYYNLNGQRVDNPKKGLYIVNGKKVMVK